MSKLWLVGGHRLGVDEEPDTQLASPTGSHSTEDSLRSVRALSLRVLGRHWPSSETAESSGLGPTVVTELLAL